MAFLDAESAPVAPGSRSGPSPRAEDSPEPGATFFVWGTWLLVVLAAGWYVGQFGADIPRGDDYAVVPQLCGREPISLQWLWSQHSEHRIPLARLVLLTVFHEDGADPRPILFLDVGILAAAAASLLIAVGRRPGGWRFADAFLPLLLLQLGQYENLLWAIQITFILPVALLCFAASLIASAQGRPGFWRAAGVGTCATVMPFCNAGGLLLAPPLLLWLIVAASAEWRSGRPASRRRGVWIAVAAIPAVVTSGFYLLGYDDPSHHAARGGIVAGAGTTLQFLATALGTPAIDLWPWSGFAAAAVIASAAIVLNLAWFRRPEDRWRIGGLLAALGSTILLATATGWGRSGEGDSAGLQLRYVTLATPTLAVAYLAFAREGGRFVRSFAPMILFAAACALLWPNVETAIRQGRDYQAKAAAFDRDRAAGLPIFRLTNRHALFVHPSQNELHDLLEMLRSARIGDFARVQPDPAFRESPVSLQPSNVRLGRWENGEMIATGVDPWLTFNLPSPQRVAGVRIRYDHDNVEHAPAHFRFAWRPVGRLDRPDPQVGEWNLGTGPDQTTTIWIDEAITAFRIQPDNRPCRFRIRELTLLLEP